MKGAPPTGSLVGVRVVVTRATHQAGPLVAALTSAGARVAPWPLLEIVPPADPQPFTEALARIEHYDWLAFTSANAVEATLTRFRHGSIPLPPMAVVGPATAHAVRLFGHTVTVEARQRDGAGLAHALVAASTPRRGQRVLVPRAADGRPELEDGLARHGFHVDAVTAYDKRLPANAAQRAVSLFGSMPIGWVIFASPRTVSHFVDLMTGWVDSADATPAWPARREELRAVAIGPTTAAALRDVGVTPMVASAPTVEGLVAALVRDVQAHR